MNHLKPSLIALALVLTLSQTQPIHAANNLAAILQALQEEGNGVGYQGTNDEWLTNSSAASVLSNSIALDHLQEFVSASYGELSLGLNLDEFGVSPPPGPDSGYGGYGALQASWSDTVTIDNAALAGTMGYLRPTIVYSWNTSASCVSDSDDSYSQLEFLLWGSEDYYSAPNAENPDTGYGIPNQYQVVLANPENSPQTQCVSLDNAGMAAEFLGGAANLDMAFVYGQPFDFSFALTLNTGGGGEGDFSTLNHRGTLKLVWEGAEIFDANTNPVTDFTVTSDSGTDWSVSQDGTGVLQVSGFSLLTATNLVINGANGTAFDQVYLLSSTDLTAPVASWAPVGTNSFDVFGNVSFTNAMRVCEPQRYFQLSAQ